MAFIIYDLTSTESDSNSPSEQRLSTFMSEVRDICYHEFPMVKKQLTESGTSSSAPIKRVILPLAELHEEALTVMKIQMETPSMP